MLVSKYLWTQWISAVYILLDMLTNIFRRTGNAVCIYRGDPGDSGLHAELRYPSSNPNRTIMSIFCLIPLERPWTLLSLHNFELKSTTTGLLEDEGVIFWPSTQPKNTIPRWYTGRKWHIQMASNRKRSRGRIKAYDMGQGEGPIVPLQWCTGRE